MKKLICWVLVLLVVLTCLLSCTFSKNLSGSLAGEAESTAKVEEMMTALAENRASDAKSLMHPKVAENSDTAIDQMSSYIDCRKVDSMELTSINVNSSTGTNGETREEKVTYQVTLDDGVVIHLNVVHLSDNDGTGFSSFQLVMGVV